MHTYVHAYIRACIHTCMHTYVQVELLARLVPRHPTPPPTPHAATLPLPPPAPLPWLTCELSVTRGCCDELTTSHDEARDGGLAACPSATSGAERAPAVPPSHRVLRLVFLNGCQSEALGTKLRSSGVECVVCCACICTHAHTHACTYTCVLRSSGVECIVCLTCHRACGRMPVRMAHSAHGTWPTPMHIHPCPDAYTPAPRCIYTRAQMRLHPCPDAYTRRVYVHMAHGPRPCTSTGTGPRPRLHQNLCRTACFTRAPDAHKMHTHPCICTRARTHMHACTYTHAHTPVPRCVVCWRTRVRDHAARLFAVTFFQVAHAYTRPYAHAYTHMHIHARSRKYTYQVHPSFALQVIAQRSSVAARRDHAGGSACHRSLEYVQAFDAAVEAVRRARSRKKRLPVFELTEPDPAGLENRYPLPAGVPVLLCAGAAGMSSGDLRLPQPSSQRARSLPGSLALPWPGRRAGSTGSTQLNFLGR